MSGSNFIKGCARTFTLRAANDFSATNRLGRAVTILGDYADSGAEAVGVALNTPSSGQELVVGFDGVLPFRSIAVQTPGIRLTVVTCGFLGEAGSGTFHVGYGLGAQGYHGISPTPVNITSNALGIGVLSFINPWYLPLSAGAGYVVVMSL